MRILTPITLLLLLLAPCARPDSVVVDVAKDISMGSVVQMPFVIAKDLAQNVLTAQEGVWYAGPASLADSIWSVDHAIAIEDCVCSLAWLQSTIAIDPNATLGFTPSAVNFGAVRVATPEPPTWILVVGTLTIAFLIWLVLHRRRPPHVPSPYGPVTEKARRRAALNMREDPELKQRVEEAAILQAGGDVNRGMAKVRYQFPEAYKK